MRNGTATRGAANAAPSIPSAAKTTPASAPLATRRAAGTPAPAMRPPKNAPSDGMTIRAQNHGESGDRIAGKERACERSLGIEAPRADPESGGPRGEQIHARAGRRHEQERALGREGQDVRPEQRGADRTERPEAIHVPTRHRRARASRSQRTLPPGDRAPRSMRQHRRGAPRRRPVRELPPGRHPSPSRLRRAAPPTPPRWPRPLRPSRRVPGTTALRTSRPTRPRAPPRGRRLPPRRPARAIAGASAHGRAARRPPRAASHRKPSVSAIGTRCEAACPAGSGRPKLVVKAGT